MKLRFALMLVLVLVVFAAPIYCQTNTLVQTYTNGAISDANTTLVKVYSATGISSDPPTILYVDREVMRVVSVSGTNITVRRGTDGSAATGHITGTGILAGRPDWFMTYDPPPGGSCTTANTYVTPWLNVRTGDQWLCSTVEKRWIAGFGNTKWPQGVNTAHASGTAAMVVSGPMFHISGTSTITSIVVPVGCLYACSITVIFDSTGALASGNTIGASVTGAAGLAVTLTYSNTDAKWYLSSK
jgi:hypothetical protein